MKQTFCNIRNANTCDSDLKTEVMAQLKNIQHADDMTISNVHVSHLIRHLKCG